MLVQKEENYSKLVCKPGFDKADLLHEIKALKSMGENIIVDLSKFEKDPGRDLILEILEEMGKWGVILGLGDWAIGYMEQEYSVVPTLSEATDYVFMLSLEREL